MTISISPNTVSSIENLITVGGEHPNKKNLLIRDIKSRASHNVLCSKLIFLKKCLTKRIAPKQIVSLAKRTVSETGRSEEIGVKRTRWS